jgi:hypothetical protein
MTRSLAAAGLAACALLAAQPWTGARADALADLSAKGLAGAIAVTRPGIADLGVITLADLVRCLMHKPRASRAGGDPRRRRRGPLRIRVAVPHGTVTFHLTGHATDGPVPRLRPARPEHPRRARSQRCSSGLSSAARGATA